MHKSKQYPPTPNLLTIQMEASWCTGPSQEIENCVIRKKKKRWQSLELQVDKEVHVKQPEKHTLITQPWRNKKEYKTKKLASKWNPHAVCQPEASLTTFSQTSTNAAVTNLCPSRTYFPSLEWTPKADHVGDSKPIRQNSSFKNWETVAKYKSSLSVPVFTLTYDFWPKETGAALTAKLDQYI